ncbi:MAG: DHHA1 domain-containing protein, partial [Akkermansia sp.]
VNAALDEFHAYCDALREAAVEADKRLKKAQSAAAASQADALLKERLTGGNAVVVAEGGNDLLTELFNGLRKIACPDAVFLIVDDGNSLSLGAYCGANAQAAGLKAGDLIRTLAPIVGGKGGGKADMARGAGKNRAALPELETKAKELLNL